MSTASNSFSDALSSSELLTWASGLALVGVLWYLLMRGQMNLLATVVIAGTLLLVCAHSKAMGAIVTLAYLFLMGDIRRIVAAAFGAPKYDLLLLIGPAIAVILFLPLLLKLRLKDPLSKAMLLLLAVMVLEVFNPQQGGLTVGATGALFYIVPVLWFWIGRDVGSVPVVKTLLYKAVFPLAVLAAVMGLGQTFIGFLPYQQAWIQIASKSYSALHVGSTIRAFGFSVSGAEYSVLLTASATGVAAAYYGTKRLWILAFPLLLVALVYASARNQVLKLIFALAAIYVLRKGQQLSTVAIVRLGLISVLGLAALIGLASRFAGSGKTNKNSSAAENALEHQAGGFAHPLDKKYSTASVHSKMLAGGVVQGFTAPLGHGLGATTEASKKFGGAATTSSEVDFSDMFISIGLVGGLTYCYIMYAVAKRAAQYVGEVDRTVSLPAMAVLATTVTGWLIGGQYSTSCLIFFLMGALVYNKAEVSVASPSAAAVPSPMALRPALQL